MTTILLVLTLLLPPCVPGTTTPGEWDLRDQAGRVLPCPDDAATPEPVWPERVWMPGCTSSCQQG